MPFTAKEDMKERDSRDVEDSTTAHGKVKKRPVFEIKSVPLHHTWKVGNMTNSDFRLQTHLANACEEDVHFRENRSSYRM